eukprot:PITA_23003
MPSQPNPNTNNRQEQQAYTGETSYLAYVVEIQEINLRSERVLLEIQPLPPPREVEEEREESMPKVIYPKNLGPRSPVVDVNINGTIVPRTLIELGAAINVMTKDTMLKLNLQGSLRKTTIVLQLADCSIVTLEGIVEDVMVSIDSWEYPTDFLVLQPKAKLTGYPLILERP